MTTASHAEIYSTLACDEDMQELIEMYVAEMSERITALEQAFAASDFAALGALAHQTKGSAGSYGFDELTPPAAALEISTRDLRTHEHVRRNLDDLLSMCRRIRAGSPPAGIDAQQEPPRT